MSFMAIVHLGLFPLEMGRDVGEGAIGLALEHVLVAVRRLQGTEVGDVGAYLNVVKLLFVYVVGDVLPATVPSHFVAWISLMDVGGKGCHLVGCSVAAHKTDTGDTLSMLGHHAVYGLVVEWSACISPKIGAVASRTSTGAPCDVDGQRGLVGHLLEDDVSIDILKHCGNSGGEPPPGVPARSC